MLLRSESMENLIQDGERRFRQNLLDENLDQMMPVLMPGIEPELLCFRGVAFRIMLQQELLRSIRYTSYMALVLVKLEAEDAGDKLPEVVSIVRRSIRTTDIVGQFSDEGILGIILLNAPSGATNLVVDRIRDEISMLLKDPDFASDPSRVISIVCPGDANSWEGLMQVAGKKLN